MHAIQPVFLCHCLLDRAIPWRLNHANLGCQEGGAAPVLHVLTLLGSSPVATRLDDALRALGPDVSATRIAAIEEIPYHTPAIGPSVALVAAAALPAGLRDLEACLASTSAGPPVVFVLPLETPIASLSRCVGPAKGFVFETADPVLLAMAIRAVAGGHSFAEPTALPMLARAVGMMRFIVDGMRRIDPAGDLPPRYRAAVVLAALGFTDEEISNHLSKGRQTIANYLHDAYNLLGIADRGALSRRLFGRPPCGGRPTRCPSPERTGARGSAKDPQHCPYFPVCIASL